MTGPLGATRTQPALKEWSAAVHALLDGRQTVLLRKGGIGERRFELMASKFLLFPTVAHSHAQRVRPEHRDLLARSAADGGDDEIVLRAGANVVAAVEVNKPESVELLEPLHIWTGESVRTDRLDFRPRHRLTVLVVQACPLVAPLRLTRSPDHAGCTSWLQLVLAPPQGRGGFAGEADATADWPGWAEPVHPVAQLAEIAERVRAQVG